MPYQFKDKVDLKSFKTSNINLSFRRFGLFQNVGFVVYSFGFFFEDLAVRDLSIYADSIHAKLKHYRDSADRKVDAIVELKTETMLRLKSKSIVTQT